MLGRRAVVHLRKPVRRVFSRSMVNIAAGPLSGELEVEGGGRLVVARTDEEEENQRLTVLTGHARLREEIP